MGSIDCNAATHADGLRHLHKREMGLLIPQSALVSRSSGFQGPNVNATVGTVGAVVGADCGHVPDTGTELVDPAAFVSVTTTDTRSPGLHGTVAVVADAIKEITG